MLGLFVLCVNHLNIVMVLIINKRCFTVCICIEKILGEISKMYDVDLGV